MDKENSVVSWRLTRQIADESLVVQYEKLLTLFNPAIDIGQNKEGQWVLTAFFDAHLSQREIIACISLADSVSGLPPMDIDLKPVYEKNWQEAMVREFPPVELGSFFIHSFDEDIPAGKIGLKIPAGMAFGTGEHPTTAGCLALYEKFAQEKSFGNGLDMGCGSGILAMAAAKKDGIPFLGIDNDEGSITVCRENIENNGVQEKITCVHGEGFATPVVQEKKPFDLIFANILMQPLIAMASDLADVLAPGGIVILSGYLTAQKDDVEHAYVNQGLHLLESIENNGWVASACGKN